MVDIWILVCKVPFPRGILYGEDLAHQTVVWITVAGQHRIYTCFLPEGIFQVLAKAGIVNFLNPGFQRRYFVQVETKLYSNCSQRFWESFATK